MLVMDFHAFAKELLNMINPLFPHATTTIHNESCNGDCIDKCIGGCLLPEAGKGKKKGV
jgi:hypothetical protein